MAARSVVENRTPFRGRLMSTLAEHEQVWFRSQRTIGRDAFLSKPSNWLTESHLFSVLFLRRLRFFLLFSSRQCRCGRSLDSFGHHSWRPISWRDMDVGAVNVHDGRRFEVVADRLLLFGGVQLAVDTIGSLLTARRHTATVDGAALREAEEGRS